MGIANIIKKAFHCVANLNVVTCWKKGAILVVGCPGDFVLSVDLE